jgi:hypothetical protein
MWQGSADVSQGGSGESGAAGEFNRLQACEPFDDIHVLKGGAADEGKISQAGESAEGIHVFQGFAIRETEILKVSESRDDIRVSHRRTPIDTE